MLDYQWQTHSNPFSIVRDPILVKASLNKVTSLNFCFSRQFKKMCHKRSGMSPKPVPGHNPWHRIGRSAWARNPTCRSYENRGYHFIVFRSREPYIGQGCCNWNQRLRIWFLHVSRNCNFVLLCVGVFYVLWNNLQCVGIFLLIMHRRKAFFLDIVKLWNIKHSVPIYGFACI